MPIRIYKVRLSSDGQHEAHITHLQSDRGIETREQVVENIDKYHYVYYVVRPEGKGNIGVETAYYGTILGGGHEYVKPKPDNTTTDNLLSLPRF